MRHIAQNALMAVPPVRNVLSRFHHTGRNGDDEGVTDTISRYAGSGGTDAFVGKRILELGPGQTPHVLLAMRAAGASRAVGLDIQRYREQDAAREHGIEIELYDGKHLPFADQTFDAVYSCDVLEHVRHPRPVVNEMRRVLAPGGSAFARVDLRDHYYLATEERWLTCMAFSTRLWNAMTWYRSSFVNRLRLSEWDRLFAEAGLVAEYPVIERSEILAGLHDRKALPASMQRLTRNDAATYRFDVRLTVADSGRGAGAP
jgi:ubiquinone/menaquinone biosynthesis C-methylase UbiE